MNALSVLVVDDEPLARRRLVRLLHKIDWIDAVEEAGNIIQARAAVEKCAPDILLLDIQMPGGTGFELLDHLADAPPIVIFVTAFDHHALRAFDANAVDYLTKPLEPRRFARAMERAREAAEARVHVDRIAELQETLSTLKTALHDRGDRTTELWVKSHGDYLRIAPEDIIRFQAERDYVRIHVQNADYLYQESLASLGRRLDPGSFWRVHRGTIVRRDAIKRVKPAPFASLILVLSDGSEVRVGRTYSPTIRAALAR